jgi:hypothetical protein
MVRKSIVTEGEDCERVKRRLEQMCCRFYLFIFLDGIKEGLVVSPWM